eukprot:748880-Hanusia_phi.AAC.4
MAQENSQVTSIHPPPLGRLKLSFQMASSEVFGYGGEEVLREEGYRTWRFPGRQAELILKLGSRSRIGMVRVVNAGSQLVQVFCGQEDEDLWEPLTSRMTLRTAEEVRAGKALGRHRTVSLTSTPPLLPQALMREWSRLKIVCSCHDDALNHLNMHESQGRKLWSYMGVACFEAFSEQTFNDKPYKGEQINTRPVIHHAVPGEAEKMPKQLNSQPPPPKPGEDKESNLQHSLVQSHCFRKKLKHLSSQLHKFLDNSISSSQQVPRESFAKLISAAKTKNLAKMKMLSTNLHTTTKEIPGNKDKKGKTAASDKDDQSNSSKIEQKQTSNPRLNLGETQQDTQNKHESNKRKKIERQAGLGSKPEVVTYTKKTTTDIRTLSTSSSNHQFPSSIKCHELSGEDDLKCGVIESEPRTTGRQLEHSQTDDDLRLQQKLAWRIHQFMNSSRVDHRDLTLRMVMNGIGCHFEGRWATIVREQKEFIKNEVMRSFHSQQTRPAMKANEPIEIHGSDEEREITNPINESANPAGEQIILIDVENESSGVSGPESPCVITLD